ncbi:hypothetical protein BGZ76_003484 [Entomortierella beljakovae]|nr:hypothetical protein BGZ76_003484 [Entomortierella beljakovae]
MSSASTLLNKNINLTRMVHQILKGIPAGLVISLNAWAVSAWLKATILINSQPRWLFRKKRWSEAEMRSISCYYLVVAYLMLRIVRLTSSLTKRPGRPYGDFFRNVRPILGQVGLFSITTMAMDEFIMFYILRKFGLEKQRFMITGRPIDKEIQVSDDDCCICYGAMLDDDDINERDEYSNTGRSDGISRSADHVLENFCVEKQHVAHRGCIRKWYNYGPKGYQPMQVLRILRWRTTLRGAVATPRAVGNRIGLGWLLSLPQRNDEARVPLVGLTEEVLATTVAPENATANNIEEAAAAAAEPVLRPLFTHQHEDYEPGNAGRKTCPACRQQLILNFVDLARGRKEMGYLQKLEALGKDMTKFSDWRGLVLRSLITLAWVGVTIVGGKLRIIALDKTIIKHQMNRALAGASTLAASSISSSS